MTVTITCYILYDVSSSGGEDSTVSKKRCRIVTPQHEWIVYIWHTATIEKDTLYLASNSCKYFVQSNSGDVPRNFSNNSLAVHTYSHLPLSWLQFFLESEPVVRQVSEDLSMIQHVTKYILPSPERIFHILHLVKPQHVKMIWIGQDPYPQPGVADGIAFSTIETNPVPASLKNIFRQLHDFEHFTPDTTNPNLTRWVVQGVLMMNSALTVAEKIGEHTTLWRDVLSALFTYVKDVRTKLNKSIVVCYFGSEAKTKFHHVFGTAATSRLVFESIHPSPTSVDAGFFDTNLFTRMNNMLVECGETPVDYV